MKKTKILAVIVFLIVILNLIIPSFSFAIEQDNNETDLDSNTVNAVGVNEEDLVVNQNAVDENDINVNVAGENVLDENNEEEIEENRNLPVEEEDNEEISLCIMDGDNRINHYEKNGKYYLFVPKNVKLSEMVISYIGNIESVSNAELDETTNQITGNFKNEGQFTITLSNGQTKNVTIMQSDVPAIFVNLDSEVTLDTVNNGSKDSKYKGSVNVTGCDNKKDNISQDGIEFKGRGNTSWNMPKKPYQIKLNKKANFLGIGDSKEKKWVLIANYQDPTLAKNKIINDLCVQSGLATCPNSSYADLYVNGDYVGNYLVTDKIEIKENRVNLTDEKGLLLELDNAYYAEEDYYFQSKSGNFYSVKEEVSEDNDEVVSEAMNSFMDAINALENELSSSNPSWRKVSSMIDVDSFVTYYLVNEFAVNTDSYASSCYLYKDGDNDVIHMGPTWDYDAAFGYTVDSTGIDYTLDYAIRNVMQELYKFPQFAKLVNEKYSSVIKPLINQINTTELYKSYEKSAKINTLVWSSSSEFNKLKKVLTVFVENRKEYFNSRYSNKQIEYSTHIENKGWVTSKRSGISGTEGQGLRLEGLVLEIGSGLEDGLSLSYRTHVQNIGWQNWVSNGNLAGTTGKGLRLEAVQIKLNNSSEYSIRYRVHVQDIGWQDWRYDGEIAGTEGQAKRIEAIEIEIVERRNRLGRSNKNENALINYKAHIQDVGDTGYGSDGEIIGTIGRGLRLEGITLDLNKTLLPNVSIQADVHIQNIGWKTNLTDKQLIGTQGKGLRLEALKLKLKGKDSDKYDIKYRVHIQYNGWQDWKSNGQMAGTEGEAKRIEAIQIKIVEKNS